MARLSEAIRTMARRMLLDRAKSGHGQLRDGDISEVAQACFDRYAGHIDARDVLELVDREARKQGL